jgi:hypothetical protein
MTWLNSNKLNESKICQQHQLIISKKSAALEWPDDSGNTHGGWENIRENTKISAKDSVSVRKKVAHTLA